VRVRAFAKINRSLHVMGIRPDGYHELRTVFQSIALHDTLVARTVRGPFVLTCDAPECPADSSNLVWRAADRVWRAAKRRGRPHGVAIHLIKRIPMQAGLGGGSSDAAAAIRVFGRRWKVGEDAQRAIAADLGADVPYFFEGGTVLGLERGDLLFPLIDSPPAWVVLVIPPFGVSTKDAFAWIDTVKPWRHRNQTSPANDLEAAVADRHPEIGGLVRTLARAGAVQAGMSGSGSAVFGLFLSKTAAEHAADVVWQQHGPHLSVVLTRTIDRAVYRRLAGK